MHILSPDRVENLETEFVSDSDRRDCAVAYRSWQIENSKRLISRVPIVGSDPEQDDDQLTRDKLKASIGSHQASSRSLSYPIVLQEGP
jgi:hypothetical protein